MAPSDAAQRVTTPSPGVLVTCMAMMTYLSLSAFFLLAAAAQLPIPALQARRHTMSSKGRTDDRWPREGAVVKGDSRYVAMSPVSFG